jgi:hypothetical protein
MWVSALVGNGTGGAGYRRSPPPIPSRSWCSVKKGRTETWRFLVEKERADM